MAEQLGTYRRKRDFKGTPEPKGAPKPRKKRQRSTISKRRETAKAKRQTQPRFVVHEHHARRLHWDLRLEHDGALASWAIPNGIPTSPKKNRKAIHVEDHPLEYIDFEGTIPEGNYGAGSVAIWDSGTYQCEKWEPKKVIVTFNGEQLKGRYALFEAGSSKDWLIHRMDPPVDPDAQEMPEQIVPMFAKLGDLPRDEKDWAFEIKWDGVRALAYSQPGRITLMSRNLIDITQRYPELRLLNRALSSHSAILDGEIVAFDEEGRPSFKTLQQRMHLNSDSAIRRHAEHGGLTYVIFDLLFFDGHSLLDVPYEQRRAQLEALDLNGDAWQTPSYHRGNGKRLLEATAKQGLEGVVAKRLTSPYEPGRRSANWVKVKNSRRQELVIGGWISGKGRRSESVGALLLGHYEHDENGAPHFRYAGKVGTGFSASELDRLQELLTQIKRDTSPFDGRQPERAAQFVEPKLVAEIEFTEWTRDGSLRHPSYKGLRDDKAARDVVREDIEQTDTPWPTTGRTIADKGELHKSAPTNSMGTDESKLSKLEEGLAKARGGKRVSITLAGHRLSLSNSDKIFYPETGFTKGDVIRYYAAVAPVLLPHIHNRAVTLKRYPHGAQGSFFYQKRCPQPKPSWLNTAAWTDSKGNEIDFCLLNDLPALVWAANLADLELHTSLSHADDFRKPTMMVFDLDPGEPATLLECLEVGLHLRDLFSQLQLDCFAKTSGSKGLQIYVPLNTNVTYDETKTFAQIVAQTLARGLPNLVVDRMTKKIRSGKVFIDWSQNDEHKTTVCVYSLRARNRPTVSTPLSWDEVTEAFNSSDATSLTCEAHQMIERVKDVGDLFAPALELKQKLPN